ncbi:MAG: DUF1028 domain-containing protein [Thiohalocapsa sp. PB-PSB1]|jgi:uncharacterized Ntn-hydrolase superfamily protein|nr:MAG: hypothetical protein N838_00500 [Thiohalocapsa sp. PB-PSB1]QQO56561.1 MAG: DUF1028 domain-containing protein [Thiohalocapsa sp. PB-PSB1]HCS91299.1 DUF1028 domain-containing protein [Chromatiaceae bacterium]
MLTNRSHLHLPDGVSFVANIRRLCFALLVLLPASPWASDLIATFSIVARDPVTQDLGVAVQSKYFDVGSVVPHAQAGVGALATQARGNILYGTQGLSLLASGRSPAETLKQLLKDDPLREQRQVGLIAADGSAATFTGNETLPWSGGKTGENYAVQGNLLAGPEVVDSMAAAFETTDADLATRFVTALAAGQAAGGDARGRQSAALLVVRKGAGYMSANDRLVELEVEDHPTPIKELRRLLGIRLSQLAVSEAHAALRDARNPDAQQLRARAIEHARSKAIEAVELYEFSDAGFIALAGAEAEAGNLAAASEAARQALLLNPVLKRYSVIPETGLGIQPSLLERLLQETSFRKVWDALPGDDQVDAAILNSEPVEAAE